MNGSEISGQGHFPLMHLWPIYVPWDESSMRWILLLSEQLLGPKRSETAFHSFQRTRLVAPQRPIARMPTNALWLWSQVGWLRRLLESPRRWGVVWVKGLVI